MRAPLETDADLDAFFDLDEFAFDATILLQSGSNRRVKGIFENPIASRSITQNVDVTTPNATFVCKTEDVDEVDEGDKLRIDGRNYTIRAAMTDGAGVTTFALERD
jgi:hypothetical protein